MRTYHKEVKWPTFHEPRGIIWLRTSRHAELSTQTDRYGRYQIPAFFSFKDAEIFEVTLNELGVWHKVGVRIPLIGQRQERFDLCMIVKYDGLVITSWLNKPNDRHRTLRKEMYANV